MTRGRAALLLALVFLAGAAAGAVGMGVASRQRGPGEGLPGRAEQMMVRRIARRLDLDPDQRVILRRVAADTRGQMDDVRQRAVDRVGEILDGAFDQLEPSLRPDQREALAQLRQDARSRFRNRPGGRP